MSLANIYNPKSELEIGRIVHMPLLDKYMVEIYTESCQGGATGEDNRVVVTYLRGFDNDVTFGSYEEAAMCCNLSGIVVENEESDELTGKCNGYVSSYHWKWSDWVCYRNGKIFAKKED